MSDDANIGISIILKAVDEGSAVIAQIGTALDRLASKAKDANDQQNKGAGAKASNDFFSNLKGTVTTVSTAYLALTEALHQVEGAINAVVAPFKEGIDLWSQSEIRAKQLQIAWASAGRSMPLESMKKFNDELSQTTMFSKPALTEATKFFAGLGQVGDEMLPRVMKLATDIASFTGRDLETATLQLSRVLQGNPEALSRIGIRVSEVVASSGDLSAILGDIEKRVGGMAGTAMDEWKGKSTDIEKSWEEIKKTVGSIVGGALLDTLEAMRVRTNNFMKSIEAADKAGKFNNIKAALGMLGDFWIDTTGRLIEMFKNVGQSIVDNFGDKNASFLDNFNAALQSIKSSVDGLASLFERIAGSKVFQWLAKGAMSMNPIGLLGTIGDSWNKLFGGNVTEPFQQASKEIDILKEKTEKGQFARLGLAAITDFGGSVKEMADAWKEMYGEELPASIVAGFEAAQAKLKTGMSTTSGALSGNPFSAIAEQTLGKQDAKLKAIKDALDSATKGTEAFYETLNQVGEISLSKTVNEITATYASEKLAATAIAVAESGLADFRIANAQRVYEANKSNREQAHAAEMAIIDQQIKATKGTDAKYEWLQKRSEAEKAFRDQSLEAEKKLQNDVVAEIKKQGDAVKAALEERRKLEQEVRDEVLESLKAQESVYAKSLDAMNRLRQGYVDASRDLINAVELLPTQPEKAMELAKKARESFKGMSIDIKALQNDLKKTIDDNVNLLRSLDKKLMTPSDAYESDKKEVERLLGEAQTLANSGKLEEAAAIAGKAKGEAANLANVPQGVNLSQEEAVAQAKDLTKKAIDIEQGSKAGGIDYAKTVNDAIQKQMQEASQIVGLAQAKLLDENTIQLRIHGSQLKQLKDKLGELIDLQTRMLEKGAIPPGQKETSQAGEVLTGEGNTPSALQPGGAGKQAGVTAGKGQIAPGAQPSLENADISVFPPDLQGLFADTEALLRQAQATHAQSEAQSTEMQNRSKALKNLEHRAGTMDFNEAMGGKGFGVSPQAEQQWQSDLDAVMGRPMTGADVDSAQKNISSWFSQVTGKLGPIVDQAKKSGTLPEEIASRGSTDNTDIATKVVESVGGFAGLVTKLEGIFGGVSQGINISVNIENGEATITRY